MAFDFKYLSLVEQQQNLDPTFNSACAQVNGFGLRVFTYNGNVAGSNESAATIEGANYFLPAYGYLRVNDIILINSNDPAIHVLNVATSTSAGVTVTQLV